MGKINILFLAKMAKNVDSSIYQINITNSRLESKSHTLFVTKIGKSNTLFLAKTTRKPSSFGLHIHVCMNPYVSQGILGSPYKRVHLPPHPPSPPVFGDWHVLFCFLGQREPWQPVLLSVVLEIISYVTQLVPEHVVTNFGSTYYTVLFLSFNWWGWIMMHLYCLNGLLLARLIP